MSSHASKRRKTAHSATRISGCTPLKHECHIDVKRDVLKSDATELYDFVVKYGKPIPIHIFGRTYLTPRIMLMFGGVYRFSGKDVHIAPEDESWPPIVQEALDFSRTRFPDLHFDRALVNVYRQGMDAIGWHADDEPTLCPGTPVITFIFGKGVREFWVRDKTTKEKWIIPETENMMIAMVGKEFQTLYEHSVPKRPKIEDWRMSITIRSHV